MTNTITIGAPTANSDSSQGYGVGSVWRDIQADRFYVCTSAAVGAAVWVQQAAPATQVANFPVTQPVSVSIMPLPTGAATEATLAAIKTGTDKIPTSPAQEHVTAGSPQAVRMTDGAAFFDPRVITLPALTKGVQGAVGVSAQDLKDAGRSSVTLTAEAVAGSASEALVTMAQSVAGAASSNVTSYNVTAGKRFRLQAIIASWIATTTTANTSRIRLRVNAGGAALITSPIQLSFRLAWPSATFIANEGAPVVLPIPDGFELPGGAGLAISHIEAAANGTLDLSILGFEY